MVSLSCKEPYRELTYLILIYDPQLLTQVTIHSTTKAETSLTLDGPYKSYLQDLLVWWGSNLARIPVVVHLTHLWSVSSFLGQMMGSTDFSSVFIICFH